MKAIYCDIINKNESLDIYKYWNIRPSTFSSVSDVP